MSEKYYAAYVYLIGKILIDWTLRVALLESINYEGEFLCQVRQFFGIDLRSVFSSYVHSIIQKLAIIYYSSIKAWAQ